jgi:hypothetical protein
VHVTLFFSQTEYRCNIKHEGIKLLFPKKDVKEWAALVKDKPAFQKFKEEILRKQFQCRVYVWHDVNDPVRKSLTVYPE